MVTDKLSLESIYNSGWKFPKTTWDCLSDYEKEFATSEFSGQRTLDYYLARLQAIGFEGKERVLDAACGLGQWSVALGKLNDSVEGIDINFGRLLTAQSLSETYQTNCHFCCSPLENLPYEAETFDLVFCYGAFMFSHMPTTLLEFKRVLKPGGVIYLNANTTGWYAHLLLDRVLKNKEWNIAIDTLRMIAKTLVRKKSNVIVQESWLKKQISLAGLELVAMGAEGDIAVRDDISKPEAGYSKTYYGMTGILEALIRKN